MYCTAQHEMAVKCVDIDLRAEHAREIAKSHCRARRKRIEDVARGHTMNAGIVISPRKELEEKSIVWGRRCGKCGDSRRCGRNAVQEYSKWTVQGKMLYL